MKGLAKIKRDLNSGLTVDAVVLGGSSQSPGKGRVKYPSYKGDF